jgi:DNA helicase-2/ATP-dependent DNA helicase PcrA
MDLAHLNAAQKDAVINVNGPCMIVASAGSGKTSVLTYRISYLLEQGIDPFRIIALTFTNKAAKEMRHRVEKLVGSEAKNLWMGTFHSVFLKMLRIEGHTIGYNRNFTIYDTEDSKSLISNIINELNLDDTIYKPNVIMGRISGAKNRLISYQAYLDNPIYREEDANMRTPRTGEIFQQYVERCIKAGAMDFDDLLFNIDKVFTQEPKILRKYQEMFLYVLVDEFQDTNIAQYTVIKKLSSIHKNICVVGDDAQSIYAFRGANIQNILNFEQDFPNLITIKLEQNYRSTKSIVAVANSIISHNKNQLKKNAWTQNVEGDSVEVIRAQTDIEESSIVAISIFENRVKKNLANKDFAVLYRTNTQSRSIEEALRRLNIPYKIVGGMSFYQRKEVKDLLGYFKIIVNPHDEQALKRIINIPKRAIGSTTLDKLVIAASDNNTSIWNIMLNASDFLQGATAKRTTDFTLMIRAMAVDYETKDAYEIAKNIAQESGLLKELYEDKTLEGRSRYENVQELLNAVKDFSVNSENNSKNLGDFLQDISLLTTADVENENSIDVVTLMTVHSSKGLEFEYVYVMGMEEDLFPSTMMLNSREDLEEERRLFYVALTRAKKKLFLSYALSRYRFGKIKISEMSRFINEIDSNSVLHISNNNFFNKKQQYISENQKNAVNYKKGHTLSTTNHIDMQQYHVNSDISALAVGMQVVHPKFNLGTILKLDKEVSSPKVVVKFRQFGEKTLLLKFACLQIVSQQ